MDSSPESSARESPLSLALCNHDAAPTASFRARSDSLDIFTMSPLGTPPFESHLDPHDPDSHLRLPDPPTLDLCLSAPRDGAQDRRVYRFPSPPSSTPNSPTSFSFSPPLRAQAYGGTSYGTDITSLVGSWDRSADEEDDALKAVREDKGKDKGKGKSPVESAIYATLESAPENGKGKAKAIDPPSPHDFEFDFDFDSRHESGLDLGLRASFEDANRSEDEPVVRLSPGTQYRPFGGTSAGSSSRDERCCDAPPYNALEVATSAPDSAARHEDPYTISSLQAVPLQPPTFPSTGKTEEPLPSHPLPPSEPHSRGPTHRRSLSNLSLRSIRSSSSRSIASIRSVVIGNSAGFRGRVRSMAPAATAKKLKGGLRKMFKRTGSGSAAPGSADTHAIDIADEDIGPPRIGHPLRASLDLREDERAGQEESNLDQAAHALESHGERRAFELHDRGAIHESDQSEPHVNSQELGHALDSHEPGRITDSHSPERAIEPHEEYGHAPETSSDSQATMTLVVTSGTVHVPDVALENRPVLGAKPRSMSSPLPFSGVAGEGGTGHAQEQDLQKHAELEVEVKVEVEVAPVVPNRFNDALPRELQLTVLRMLVDVHEADHARAERGEDQQAVWTVRMAGRTRWAGRDRGVRELVKLSRVSKAWQSLAFDGQLWDALHLTSAPPHLSPALLLKLAEHAGSFVRSLDLRGWTHLDPVTLRALVRSLSLAPALDPSPISPLATLSIAPPPRFPPTNLTRVSLRTCTSLTAHSLHHVLLRAPFLRSIDLRGLSAVTNTTCGVLATYCPRLESADLGRCANMDGDGLKELVGCGLARSWTSAEGGSLITREDTIVQDTERSNSSKLRVLRASGMKRVDEDVLAGLGAGAPELEVLDLSGARDLTDEAIEAFVAWDDSWDTESPDEQCHTKIELSARDMGRDPTADFGPFYKRVTRLRHLSLSSCPLLTDVACTYLAHCVPRLEFLELAGIGPELKDNGLVRLLGSTPLIRRLDLEDACDITDEVLDALTPGVLIEVRRRGVHVPPPLQPGHALEHLVLSYAANITNEALLALMRGCSHLKVLECDNTRISGAVVREFVKLARQRQFRAAELVTVDCRAITEALIKDLAGSGQTRARKGYRHYEARTLGYVDARDEEDLGTAGVLGGMDVDDCDNARVALKSFWSWQAVDTIRQAREKRRKMALSARRNTDAGVIGEAFRRSGLLGEDDEDLFGADEAGPSSRPRWLAHWTRVSGSGSSSPTGMAFGNEEDRGCIIM